MKIQLWKVDFTTTFNGSEGMRLYSLEKKHQGVYVTTCGDSISQLRAEIEATFSPPWHCQETVKEINSAIYLGKIINRPS